MFAARHIAMLVAFDDGRILRVDALQRFALRLHRTRFAAVFAAAIRAVAAVLHVRRGSRVLVFHRARAVLAAATHRRLLRRIARLVISENHHRKSENKQRGNRENYSLFHFIYLKI
jgi:hypothetical protein